MNNPFSKPDSYSLFGDDPERSHNNQNDNIENQSEPYHPEPDQGTLHQIFTSIDDNAESTIYAKEYCVYIITNPHTEKSYIGMTSNLSERMESHQRTNTVECENFDIEVIIDHIQSRELAYQLESLAILSYMTIHTGYNKTGEPLLKNVPNSAKKIFIEKMWHKIKYPEMFVHF